MARIEPLPEEEWDEKLQRLLRRDSPQLASRLADNNIFPSIARHPALFRAWLPFAAYLLSDGLLPARERELLILRTARNCRSSYEWGQHVRIAAALGMSGDDFSGILDGPEAAGWSESDAVLLRSADELHADGKIRDETWATLAGYFDEASLIEITMLVGHYHMVAFVLNSLEVELDEGLEPLPR
jgi:4-carboxymuconolactone decarboxylase